MTELSHNALRWLEDVFSERFGTAVSLFLEHYENEMAMALQVSGQLGKILFTERQPLFQEPGNTELPVTSWKASNEGYGTLLDDILPMPGTTNPPTPLVDIAGHCSVFRYDLPGLVYWSLNRLEEVGAKELDSQGRFSSSVSHAFRHQYLERPIVDEWLGILAQVIERTWPQVQLPKARFDIKVSHDADEPGRYAFLEMKGLIRKMGEDLLVRRDFLSALRGFWMNTGSRQRIHPSDPSNTFNWLMAQSERRGLTSSFYFLCGRTNDRKDARYNLGDPSIRRLLREIHARGHEIGLHPSYEAYRRPEVILKEFERLKKVCAEEGIDQKIWGGRMHFLRWDQGVTLRAWDEAGLDYDSTLGYADRPGFRCGTCHEYPAFDPINDCQLNLRLRPLVAMDCTVMAERYLGLGATEQAYEKFNQLKETCRAVDGTFTLLWHNSYFWKSEHFNIYQRLLNE